MDSGVSARGVAYPTPTGVVTALGNRTAPSGSKPIDRFRMSRLHTHRFRDPPWVQRLRLNVRKLGHYLFRGALIIAPFAITAAALRWLFVLVDGALSPAIDIPGLGFLTVLVIIALVGWLSSFFFIERFFSVCDRWLEKTPGVQYIYTTVRDFCDSFAGKKARFQRTVLANVYSGDVWCVGFLTDDNLAKFELGESHVAVYVPQSYNVGGQLFLLPRERIREIPQFAPASALKYAVTGGAAGVTNQVVISPDLPPENSRVA